MTKCFLTATVLLALTGAVIGQPTSEIASDVPIEASSDVPSEAASDVPVETASEVADEVASDSPDEAASEASSETSSDGTCIGFDVCPTEFPQPFYPGEYPSTYVLDSNVTFPDTFEWGVGTAAYQIEGAYNQGGRGASIWDTYTGANTVGMPGSVCKEAPCAVNSAQGIKGATGNVANDHYNKYLDDVATMKALGVPEYRFSIAWPRVIPTGVLGNDREGLNEEGLQFYHNLIDALIEADIKPVITLFHWDLPQGLLDANYYEDIPICDPAYKQGWYECDLKEDGTPGGRAMNETFIVKQFADYAQLIFEEFSDKVKTFATFNEAWTFTWLASGKGKAPAVRPYQDSEVWPYIAGYNVIRSHLAAVKLFRQMQKNDPSMADSRIGITNNCDWREPMTDSPQDIAASERTLEAWIGWYTDPIYGANGDYPESMKKMVGDRLPAFTDEEKSELMVNKPDYFGLNHYGTSFVRDCPDYVCDPQETNGVWNTVDVPDFVNADGANSVQILNDNLAAGQSAWLFGAAWGFRKLLNWVSNRYGTEYPIYVTENGWSVQADTEHQGKYDTGRVLFYYSYLNQMSKAISEDGVNVAGYYAWSLMDNFEWERGYHERFGVMYDEFNFCHVKDINNPNCDPNSPTPDTPVYDAATGDSSALCGNTCLFSEQPDPSTSINQTRHPKNSLLWLTEVWKSQTVVDPGTYLWATKASDICYGPDGTTYNGNSWMYVSDCNFNPIEERL
ncbi:hypothetical protein SARC_10731 [Sphaeroforma arctica JP610]|uniref:Beta-glucosidase n=1 Tax=Sphaeroforma arctica JP610 TaxID=667725 RepID=A0A0L0FJ34_9EUKA|nr:hypothetical protein SARC_10731 [Sphaeroforma arctica JP610]KNC76787.1 hypothetical protein SARC_10731 [Sphaeroforma arctica JP610]|eukprot:XP_014150689.1 hypothetical protein SARC_10731 [Sphaeroforma arctica JP610]